MVYVTGFRYLFYLLKTVEGVLNTIKSENKNRTPLKRDKAYSTVVMLGLSKNTIFE